MTHSALSTGPLTRPIKEILSGVEQLKQGKVSRPPRVFAKDELGHLTSSFNEMSGIITEQRDKLAASAPISVTRAAWATGTGTLLAGAVEVPELRSWGHAYRAPVGQDVAGTEMFEHTSLLVMGSRDGTRVAIDVDADGSAEISVTLGQGQRHHVRGSVRVGAAVSATEPVQVSLITGDFCARIQSRWYSLEPGHRWRASAYAPVGINPAYMISQSGCDRVDGQ